MEGENNTTYVKDAEDYPAELRTIPGVDPIQEMTLMRPLTELQEKRGDTPQPELQTCTLKQARRRVDRGWEFVGLGDPLSLAVKDPIVAAPVDDAEGVEVTFAGNESDDSEE